MNAAFAWCTDVARGVNGDRAVGFVPPGELDLDRQTATALADMIEADRGEPPHDVGETQPVDCHSVHDDNWRTQEERVRRGPGVSSRWFVRREVVPVDGKADNRQDAYVLRQEILTERGQRVHARGFHVRVADRAVFVAALREVT